MPLTEIRIQTREYVEPEPFDIHCPLMGKGKNYWKEKCDQRRKDPNQERTCYPYCKAAEVKEYNSTHGDHGKYKEGVRNEVAEMINEGYTRDEVAKTLNVTTQLVDQYIREGRIRGIIK